jgi:hypothetical protein
MDGGRSIPLLPRKCLRWRLAVDPPRRLSVTRLLQAVWRRSGGCLEVLAARAGGAGTARANAASIDFVPDLLMVMMERSAKCLFVRTPQRGATPPVAQDYFAIRKIPESLPSRYLVTRYIREP